MPSSTFPKLKWDGYCWRATCPAPWFDADSNAELIVSTRCSEKESAKSAPQPTGAQEKTFQHLASPSFQKALLAAFHKQIPELAGAEWEAVPQFFELANIVILNSEIDETAYCALIFNCMEYESGVGVVTHQSRIVYIGNAEEAAELVAEKDVRRQKRASRKSE